MPTCGFESRGGINFFTGTEKEDELHYGDQEHEEPDHANKRYLLTIFAMHNESGCSSRMSGLHARMNMDQRRHRASGWISFEACDVDPQGCKNVGRSRVWEIIPC